MSKRDMFYTMRQGYLDNYRIQLQRSKSIIEESLVRIERDGLNGWYSHHHDLLDSAFRVYRASKVLGTIKKLEEEITDLLEQEDTAPNNSNQPECVDPFSLPPPEEADAPSSMADNAVKAEARGTEE